jgi:hypothetical protein
MTYTSDGPSPQNPATVRWTDECSMNTSRSELSRDPIARLVASWRAEGVALNPGASRSQLSSLANVLQTPLPDDVAAFYTLANGMTDNEWDNHCVSFWSIERIIAERQETGPEEIGFADFLINSWYFVYRPLSPAGFVVGWHSDVTQAATFREFIDEYTTNPARFYVL